MYAARSRATNAPAYPSGLLDELDAAVLGAAIVVRDRPLIAGPRDRARYRWVRTSSRVVSAAAIAASSGASPTAGSIVRDDRGAVRAKIEKLGALPSGSTSSPIETAPSSENRCCFALISVPTREAPSTTVA